MAILSDPLLKESRFDFEGEPLTEEDIEEIEQESYKGGEGSGNFGHEGRPGEVGGSGGGGGGGGKPTSEKPKPSGGEKPSGGGKPSKEEFIKERITSSNSNWDKQVAERTRDEIRQAKIPDRHLEYVKSMEVNSDKLGKLTATAGVQGFVGGAWTPDGKIVLASSGAAVHEIGHGVMQEEIFSNRRGGEVMKVFAASKKTGKGFVSDYAKTDMREFFAESYAAYAKNPKGFTKKNPPMAKLLKSIW